MLVVIAAEESASRVVPPVSQGVRARTRELGVVRSGSAPTARMRIDLAVVRERIAALAQADPPAAPEPAAMNDERPR